MSSETADDDCPVCTEQFGNLRPRYTIACGHIFCRERGRGASSSSAFARGSQRPFCAHTSCLAKISPRVCPICREAYAEGDITRAAAAAAASGSELALECQWAPSDEVYDEDQVAWDALELERQRRQGRAASTPDLDLGDTEGGLEWAPTDRAYEEDRAAWDALELERERLHQSGSAYALDLELGLDPDMDGDVEWAPTDRAYEEDREAWDALELWRDPDYADREALELRRDPDYYDLEYGDEVEVEVEVEVEWTPSGPEYEEDWEAWNELERLRITG
ncbi:hypothetical protein GGX14DRAFT_384438 [Mycena pura]|uniref:Zinc finger RING-type eukaryotic domain-containing protein n=1 Tax=Mycena pura TaxID=153505 RepID=A0AAD6YVE4_9AGAR|nr:hypothetical protein GGX14DRAFT_384438 [Mycena pura]